MAKYTTVRAELADLCEGDSELFTGLELWLLLRLSCLHHEKVSWEGHGLSPVVREREKPTSCFVELNNVENS